MAETKKKVVKQASQNVPRRALLFELENVAVKGHQIVFDVLKGIFKAKDMDLPLSFFCRRCLCHAPQSFVGAFLRLAGKGRLSEQKLIEEINAEMAGAFTDARLKLDPGLKKLLKEAASRNIMIGALSSLDKNTAETLATNLGLSAMGLRLLHVPCENRCFVGVDGWLRLAKAMPVSPACCVTLTSSALSCRAAMAARMHAVAVPDSFTESQDFGGSDFVVDTLDSLSADEVFALLEPTW